MKLPEIVVVSSMWYFIKIIAFEFFTSTVSNIIVSKFFFFFENFFFIIFFIFTSFVGSSSTFIISSFFFSFSFSLICCSVAALNNWIVSIIRFFVFVKRSRRRRFLWKNRLINDWAWWSMSRIYSLWILAITFHRRLKYMIYSKRRHCFISLTVLFRRRSARIKTWEMSRSKERT